MYVCAHSSCRALVQRTPKSYMPSMYVKHMFVVLHWLFLGPYENVFTHQVFEPMLSVNTIRTKRRAFMIILHSDIGSLRFNWIKQIPFFMFIFHSACSVISAFYSKQKYEGKKQRPQTQWQQQKQQQCVELNCVYDLFLLIRLYLLCL